jgi:hypothetical protein
MVRVRGLERVLFQFTFAMAAYNLINRRGLIVAASAAAATARAECEAALALIERHSPDRSAGSRSVPTRLTASAPSSAHCDGGQSMRDDDRRAAPRQ